MYRRGPLFFAGLGGVNNYVCPPPSLVSAVLYQMEMRRAKGVLVFPEWKRAPFWPLLCHAHNPFVFPGVVKDVTYLPKSKHMFRQGRGSSYVHGSGSAFWRRPKFNVLALRVDFSRPCGEEVGSCS